MNRVPGPYWGVRDLGFRNCYYLQVDLLLSNPTVATEMIKHKLRGEHLLIFIAPLGNTLHTPDVIMGLEFNQSATFPVAQRYI